ncbi:MAG: cyclic nucleotide-binding domain-containing protein [Gammaproteobacteria bacterium]|nr:cyclic nucleotide-binding domain-containing protein [Gammaproteobacteria bacterium]
MTETIDLHLKKELIKKQRCFSRLTDEEITGLAGLLKETPFTVGDVIVTEGDIVDSVYFIVKGDAEVQHIRVKDGTHETEVIATLHPGQTIGLSETGFYSLTGLRTATVAAKTDMLTLRLGLSTFHGFALANSHVSEVMRTNAQVLTDSTDTNNF